MSTRIKTNAKVAYAVISRWRELTGNSKAPGGLAIHRGEDAFLIVPAGNGAVLAAKIRESVATWHNASSRDRALADRLTALATRVESL